MERRMSRAPGPIPGSGPCRNPTCSHRCDENHVNIYLNIKKYHYFYMNFTRFDHSFRFNFMLFEFIIWLYFSKLNIEYINIDIGVFHIHFNRSFEMSNANKAMKFYSSIYSSLMLKMTQLQTPLICGCNVRLSKVWFCFSVVANPTIMNESFGQFMFWL